MSSYFRTNARSSSIGTGSPCGCSSSPSASPKNEKKNHLILAPVKSQIRKVTPQSTSHHKSVLLGCKKNGVEFNFLQINRLNPEPPLLLRFLVNEILTSFWLWILCRWRRDELI